SCVRGELPGGRPGHLPEVASGGSYLEGGRCTCLKLPQRGATWRWRPGGSRGTCQKLPQGGATWREAGAPARSCLRGSYLEGGRAPARSCLRGELPGEAGGGGGGGGRALPKLPQGDYLEEEDTCLWLPQRGATRREAGAPACGCLRGELPGGRQGHLPVAASGGSYLEGGRCTCLWLPQGGATWREAGAPVSLAPAGRYLEEAGVGTAGRPGPGQGPPRTQGALFVLRLEPRKAFVAGLGLRAEDGRGVAASRCGSAAARGRGAPSPSSSRTPPAGPRERHPEAAPSARAAQRRGGGPRDTPPPPKPFPAGAAAGAGARPAVLPPIPVAGSSPGSRAGRPRPGTSCGRNQTPKLLRLPPVAAPTGRFRWRGNMAAAARDSRVGAGKKLKNSLKKKQRKKMQMVAGAVASELEDEGKDAADGGGSARSCGLEKDHFSSDEAVEADNEDEVEPYGNGNENAAEASVGTDMGWADAMAKILNRKTPKSKPSILVKNRELEKEKEKLKQERLEKRKQLDKKREWEMMCRVKPDVVKDKETERNLQRIATRGVVQLFNAVQKHQKNVDEKVKEAGSSIRKRAKLISTVSKKDFISVLRGMDASTSEKSSTGKNLKAKQTEAKSEESPGWTILRDDFMMGASMKDWDKESDGVDNSEPGSGSDFDT
uniref:RRP15-like protein n=1 Tax=Canis lupus familiaris TaxID=9615 RepID=A0A8C0SI61_CANLF